MVIRYEIPTKLVGVTFDNENGTSRQALLGELSDDATLKLVPEPDNPYDKNAHVVMWMDSKLGHINKNLVLELIEKQKAGQKLLGISSFMKTGNPEEKQSRGLNIMIKMEKYD